jgi:hypothetical protein
MHVCIIFTVGKESALAGSGETFMASKGAATATAATVATGAESNSDMELSLYPDVCAAGMSLCVCATANRRLKRSM